MMVSKCHTHVLILWLQLQPLSQNISLITFVCTLAFAPTLCVKYLLHFPANIWYTINGGMMESIVLLHCFIALVSA